MFGAEILDVAIGLIFIFLTLSLAVTATNEMFAAWFKRRAWMLQKGIENLLKDGETTAKLLVHPLIQGLYEPKGWISGLPILKSLFGSGPSYIQSRTFAVALLDIAKPVRGGQWRLSEEDEKQPLNAVLKILWNEAKGNEEAFKKNVEVWFNDSMERVSGWYKRRTMFVTLICAVVVTLGTNADTLVITRALWSDPALRQAVVDRAVRTAHKPPATPEPVRVDDAPPPPPLPPDQQADADFEQAEAELQAAKADLADLQLPIGWRVQDQHDADEDSSIDAVRLVNARSTDDWPGGFWHKRNWDAWGALLYKHLLGWLITILAVSLGAPFWFDMLNKVVSIRSAGKAPEEKQKSPKEKPKPRDPGPLSAAPSPSTSTSTS